MPNNKQAEKRLRQDKKRNELNSEKKRHIQYLRRSILKLITSGDTSKAKELLVQFQKAVDKATKTYLHKNTAARMKSRLVAHIKAGK